MDKYERYIKSADRGEFQYQVDDEDPETGRIYIESCIYKEKCVGIIHNLGDSFEVEADFLQHEPVCICEARSSKKRARELLERIVKNDEENNGKNMKYAV